MSLDTNYPHNLTVLHSHPLCPQTRIFRPGFNRLAKASSRAKFYQAEVVSFESCDQIEQNVSLVERDPTGIIVYGTLSHSADRSHMQRKYNGVDTTLIAVPRTAHTRSALK